MRACLVTQGMVHRVTLKDTLCAMEPVVLTAFMILRV